MCTQRFHYVCRRRHLNEVDMMCWSGSVTIILLCFRYFSSRPVLYYCLLRFIVYNRIIWPPRLNIVELVGRAVFVSKKCVKIKSHTTCYCYIYSTMSSAFSYTWSDVYYYNNILLTRPPIATAFALLTRTYLFCLYGAPSCNPLQGQCCCCNFTVHIVIIIITENNIIMIILS